MRPDGLVFDLDGTLWDTTEACALAWNRVARELGIIGHVVTAEDMHRVTGLPHTEAVRRVFKGLPEVQVEAISVRSQVEDNRVIAESGGTLYSGVAENVPVLSGRLPLYIVSNCQSGYVEIFLKTSGLGAHFSDFECWGNRGTRGKASPKTCAC